MITVFEWGLVGGLIAVASNPSPYYAAFGLVCSAGAGCLLLVDGGVSFLSLVLFLIYLGGMMVVFVYSAALVAESYPEAWGGVEIKVYLGVFMMLVWFWWLIGGVREEAWVNSEKSVTMADWFGVSSFFMLGGWFLLVGGWCLLLTLFVVLEVVRGRWSGALRAV